MRPFSSRLLSDAKMSFRMLDILRFENESAERRSISSKTEMTKSRMSTRLCPMRLRKIIVRENCQRGCDRHLCSMMMETA